MMGYASSKYQTEKRKANVGERILIKDAEVTGGRYSNGSVGTVKKHCPVVSDLVYVEEWSMPVDIEEYEVIVESPKPTKNARITALETEVDALKAKVEALEKASKYPLTARFDAETNAEADRIMAEIKRKAKTPNQQRADVIKCAKAFVADALNRNYSRNSTPKITTSHKTVWFSKSGGSIVTDKAEFIVNSNERTVVALINSVEGNDVVHKGIAKCDPSDVFNADIGKAIALGRALGVDVTEFTKAVQPTEVVVGHVIENTGIAGGIRKCTRIVGNTVFRDNGFSIGLEYAKIIEDTDAVYE